METDETGQGPIDEEDARLKSLDERLAQAHIVEADRTGSRHKAPDKGYSLGNRVLADLIAGVGGGALFGWLFDRWGGTSPWGLIVLLFLGMAVAFRNIIRISSGRSE